MHQKFDIFLNSKCGVGTWNSGVQDIFSAPIVTFIFWGSDHPQLYRVIVGTYSKLTSPTHAILRYVESLFMVQFYNLKI